MIPQGLFSLKDWTFTLVKAKTSMLPLDSTTSQSAMVGATRVIFQILLGVTLPGGFNRDVTLLRLLSYLQEKDVLGFFA